MKILHIIAGAKQGGAESCAVDTIRALAIAGIEQILICRPHQAFLKLVDDCKLDHHILSFHPMLKWAQKAKINAIIKREKPDLVHSWMNRAASFTPKQTQMPVLGWFGGYYDLKNYYTGLFPFGDGNSNNLSYTIALSRNNTYTNPIFPLGGSEFVLSARLTLPYSLWNGIDYANLGDLEKYQDDDGNPDPAKIEQEKYRWLEFYKVKFKGTWYTRLFDKLVLRTHTEFGFLGAYNNDRGVIPFDRFFLGGDGMSQYAMDGRETISLRGYPNQSLSSQDGSTIYNRFSLELRYPITLKPAASIFGLTFIETGQGYNSFREFNPFNGKRSLGLGLRIFMPAFGLLGIDFGYGLDAVNDQDLTPNGWETHLPYKVCTS